MKIKWLIRKDVQPKVLNKGDTYSLDYRKVFVDAKGNYMGENTERLVSMTFKKEQVINHVGVYKIKDFGGLKSGFGSVFGEKK